MQVKRKINTSSPQSNAETHNRKWHNFHSVVLDLMGKVDECDWKKTLILTLALQGLSCSLDKLLILIPSSLKYEAESIFSITNFHNPDSGHPGVITFSNFHNVQESIQMLLSWVINQKLVEHWDGRNLGLFSSVCGVSLDYGTSWTFWPYSCAW